LYGVADSRQLWQRQTVADSVPHSGQLNFTHLSFGMMCLWQQLHTGRD